MAKANIRFSATSIKVDPSYGKMDCDIDIESPQEILECIVQQDIIDYCEDNLLSSLDKGKFLNSISVSDAIDHYGIAEILEYIPDDVLIKHLRDNHG